MCPDEAKSETILFIHLTHTIYYFIGCTSSPKTILQWKNEETVWKISLQLQWLNGFYLLSFLSIFDHFNERIMHFSYIVLYERKCTNDIILCVHKNNKLFIEKRVTLKPHRSWNILFLSYTQTTYIHKLIEYQKIVSHKHKIQFIYYNLPLGKNVNRIIN